MNDFNKNTDPSRKTWKRIKFLVVFVIVYSILSLFSVLVSFGNGMAEFEGKGPMPGSFAYYKNFVFDWLSLLLMLPTTLVHRTFFYGGPLPISDWFWMVLAGLFYGIPALLVVEKFKSKNSVRKFVNTGWDEPYYVEVLVNGMTKKEIQSGIEDLKAELLARNWIIAPEIHWNRKDNYFVVEVGYDVDALEKAQILALDEIRDCVVASFAAESEIKFEVIKYS